MCRNWPLFEDAFRLPPLYIASNRIVCLSTWSWLSQFLNPVSSRGHYDCFGQFHLMPLIKFSRTLSLVWSLIRLLILLPTWSPLYLLKWGQTKCHRLYLYSAEIQISIALYFPSSVHHCHHHPHKHFIPVPQRWSMIIIYEWRHERSKSTFQLQSLNCTRLSPHGDNERMMTWRVG